MKELKPIALNFHNIMRQSFFENQEDETVFIIATFLAIRGIE